MVGLWGVLRTAQEHVNGLGFRLFGPIGFRTLGACLQTFLSGVWNDWVRLAS